jgi:hypothetical protein
VGLDIGSALCFTAEGLSGSWTGCFRITRLTRGGAVEIWVWIIGLGTVSCLVGEGRVLVAGGRLSLVRTVVGSQRPLLTFQSGHCDVIDLVELRSNDVSLGSFHGARLDMC